MNLFLDVISPIPEFSIIEDNKIINSTNIINLEEEKLSDSIVKTYIKLEDKFDLKNNLKSIIVTIGPGSYTSLRVGISFAIGLHFSNMIKIASLSSEDLLNFEINNNKLNYGFYIMSSNNQRFICYKFLNSNFKYIKLEENHNNNLSEINNLDFLFYNCEPLSDSLINCSQKKILIKDKLTRNLNNLEYNKSILKPIYISNNNILN